MNNVSNDVVPDFYSPSQLAARFGLNPHEAKRLICRFGSDRTELERLLTATYRTSVHRSEDVKIPSSRIAFGLGSDEA